MNIESQIETSMSTFRRYQSVFGNYDLETGNSNIKVTAFDIDVYVNIEDFAST